MPFLTIVIAFLTLNLCYFTSIKREKKTSRHCRLCRLTTYQHWCTHPSLWISHANYWYIFSSLTKGTKGWSNCHMWNMLGKCCYRRRVNRVTQQELHSWISFMIFILIASSKHCTKNQFALVVKESTCIHWFQLLQLKCPLCLIYQPMKKKTWNDQYCVNTHSMSCHLPLAELTFFVLFLCMCSFVDESVCGEGGCNTNPCIPLTFSNKILIMSILYPLSYPL